MDNDAKKAMMVASDGVLGAGLMVFLGAYGGGWLDEKLHTAPWLTITLSITGGTLGLVRLVKKANALNSNSPIPPAKPETGNSDKVED